MNAPIPAATFGAATETLAWAAAAVHRAHRWPLDPRRAERHGPTPAPRGAGRAASVIEVDALGGTLLSKGPEVIACVVDHWVRGNRLDPAVIAARHGLSPGMAMALVVTVEDLDPHAPEVEIARIHGSSALLRRPSYTLPPKPADGPAPRPVAVPPPGRPSQVRTKAVRAGIAAKEHVQPKPAPASWMTRLSDAEGRDLFGGPVMQPWSERQVERSASRDWPGLSLQQAIDAAGELRRNHGTSVLRSHDVRTLGGSSQQAGTVILGAMRAYGFLSPSGQGMVRLSDLAMSATGPDDAGRREAVRRAGMLPVGYASVMASVGPAPSQAGFAEAAGLARMRSRDVAILHACYLEGMALVASVPLTKEATPA